jgi:hypothetical protein
MPRILLFVLTAIVTLAADDPWAKVKDLKSGTELRVYKKGASQPLLVKMDEVTDENLIVVNKNAQMAVPKDQIDRVDYRPVKARVTKETRTTVSNGGEATPPAPGPNQNAGGPSTSTSTSVSFGSKPDFETIYRRPAAAPKK